MKVRTILIVLLLALVAAFTVVNWNAFTAPATLSLLVGTVQAPLGLVLLGIIVVISLAFVVFIALQQASVLLETRRMAKELAAQRALADEAEASRFTDLRRHLDEGLAQAEAQAGARHQALSERLDRLEEGLRSSVEQSGNSLAAIVGEIDDRVERLLSTKRLPAPGA